MRTKLADVETLVQELPASDDDFFYASIDV